MIIRFNISPVYLAYDRQDIDWSEVFDCHCLILQWSNRLGDFLFHRFAIRPFNGDDDGTFPYIGEREVIRSFHHCCLPGHLDSHLLQLDAVGEGDSFHDIYFFIYLYGEVAKGLQAVDAVGDECDFRFSILSIFVGHDDFQFPCRIEGGS